ncbi:hypothetical protein ACVWZ8_001475 [Arthrobacter sp. UYCu723]
MSDSESGTAVGNTGTDSSTIGSSGTIRLQLTLWQQYL